MLKKIYYCAEKYSISPGIIFEGVVQASYETLLKSGEQAIDIGAHKGSHLYGMAESVGKSGKIYAFEPIPTLFRRLKKQRRKRHLSQIKLYRNALGLSKQKTTFQYFHKFPAYSGLNRRDTPFNDIEGELEEITVKQTTLDRIFWYKKSSINYIKLDIEGGELHALMGGKRLLSHSRPIIVFEGGNASSASIYGYTKEDFFGFFEMHHMSIYTIDGQPFTEKSWDTNPEYPCWEFVALPNEKQAIIQKFPEFCTQAIERVSASNQT